MMYYVTIENPVTETFTKKDYKTERGALKAYEKATANPDNMVYMCRYATGNEIFDTTIKTTEW